MKYLLYGLLTIFRLLFIVVGTLFFTVVIVPLMLCEYLSERSKRASQWTEKACGKAIWGLLEFIDNQYAVLENARSSLFRKPVKDDPRDYE